ncbi:MAG: diguanylate cyclase [Fibrobacterales bacterium]
MVSNVFFFIAGFLGGLSLLSIVSGKDEFIYAIPVAVVALVLAILNYKPVISRLTQKVPVVKKESAPTQPSESEGDEDLHVKENTFKTDAVKEKDSKIEEGVGKNLKKKLWMEVEKEIDTTLYAAIMMLKWMIPASKSILIFFPGPKKQTIALRVHHSDSSNIIPDVIIQPNQGLTGLLIKDDVERILEGDLHSSKTLFYYDEEEQIRSIAGVPVMVQGKKNGAVVIDSREAQAFGEDTIHALTQFATVLGQYVYTSYMNSEHIYQKEQLAFLYYYQEKFFAKMSVLDIFDNIESYIKNSLPFDRILILAVDETNKNKGQVVKSFGLDAEYFQNMNFSMTDKGLLQVAFHKNRIIPRTIRANETIYRISRDEQPNNSFKSLLAVPVSIDESVELVICIESTRIPQYSDHHISLLSSLAGVAGFALARARAYEEKHEQASKDGLTGLINHKTFQEKLRIESLRVSRMNSSFAIMMIDLDHFKKVNDTYGHPIGDIVLKETSKIIAREVRGEVDIVARYGGEEFIIMLIDADESVVSETAERIRASIAGTDFNIMKDKPLKCTCSIGYALFPEHSNNAKEVVGKADIALYKAKDSGRNQAVGYN